MSCKYEPSNAGEQHSIHYRIKGKVYGGQWVSGRTGGFWGCKGRQGEAQEQGSGLAFMRKIQKAISSDGTRKEKQPNSTTNHFATK